MNRNSAALIHVVISIPASTDCIRRVSIRQKDVQLKLGGMKRIARLQGGVRIGNYLRRGVYDAGSL